MIVKFEGYMPDADPTLAGVITDCQAIVPSMRGMKAAPSAQSTVLSALAATCQGAAILRKLDDTTRFIAGTGTKLYEAVSGVWTDRTRGTGNYTAGADVRWRFAQFGNVSLAANKSDTIQYSSSGAFADVSGAPKAGVIETVGQFVMACDTNDGTYGDSSDRWWCSAKGDYSSWTPAVSTECTTGRLTSSPGKIKAARRFGDGIVIYKDRSMFIGTYVGAPAVWDFREIPGTIGASSQEVVIDVGTPEEPRHIFMGYEDFYSFDGSRPVPIGTNRLKETVFNELNKAYAFGSWALHDRINSRIYFYYPTGSSINPTKCVVYNYRTDRWGRDDRTIEAAVEYVTAGVTYADVGTLYSKYQDLPNISYGSSFWTSGFPVPAIFNTSHVVQTLDGTPSTSSITTGDYGDDSGIVMVSKIRPRFLTVPSSASMTNFYRDILGSSLTTDQTVSMTSGKFDVLRSSRWHRFSFSFNGAMEITGISPTFIQDGEE